MKYFVSALWKIITSWYVIIAILLDIISFIIVSFSKLTIPFFIYAIIFGAAFFLSCVVIIADQLRSLDKSMPQVISNDNLSLGGPNLSIDSISLINIGGGMAKITNISSDEFGEIRIIDDHYMASFIIAPGSPPLNIMVNEAKIIKGFGEKTNESLSIVRDWSEPFYIYIWYESVSGKGKYCTKVGFRSGNRFIQNLGWEQIKVK